jgi:Flp pilus assembly protein TadD
MARWRLRLAAAGVLLAVCQVPVHAGLFDSSQPPKATISDQTIDQIKRALDDQRYLDAGQLLDQALMAANDDARLIVLAGELGLARGHADEALINFKSVDTNPAVRAHALEGEGIALAVLGRSDEAITVLQSAVAANPDAWRAWNALGTEFDKRHDWQKAELAYAHAMSGSNGAAIVLNNRGFSRLSQNRVDEAITDFVLALQKKPDFTSARNNLRLAIAMQGDYQRAVSGVAPTDRAAALNNAGYVAMLRGDYAKAKDLFGQAMKAKGEYYGVAADNLEMTQGLEAGLGGTPGKNDGPNH